MAAHPKTLGVAHVQQMRWKYRKGATSNLCSFRRSGSQSAQFKVHGHVSASSRSDQEDIANPKYSTEKGKGLWHHPNNALSLEQILLLTGTRPSHSRTYSHNGNKSETTDCKKIGANHNVIENPCRTQGRKKSLNPRPGSGSANALEVLGEG